MNQYRAIARKLLEGGAAPAVEPATKPDTKPTTKPGSPAPKRRQDPWRKREMEPGEETTPKGAFVSGNATPKDEAGRS